MEKGFYDDGEASKYKRMGVLKSVDTKECRKKVRWLKPINFLENAFKFHGYEVVSVFELAIPID